MLPENLQVVRKVAQIFDELDIGYLVGGSIASSLFGLYRSTMDVDFVVDLQIAEVPRLVNALKNEFYVDAELIMDAINTETSFNVLHLPTMVKADIFLLKSSAWAKAEWSRRRLEQISSTEEELRIYLASPEDMIIQKLTWFRIGGGVSDRQWSDVQGILKVQSPALDYAYLQQWAVELKLTDLLQKAFEEADIDLSHQE